jgi:hypothetical protein
VKVAPQEAFTAVLTRVRLRPDPLPQKARRPLAKEDKVFLPLAKRVRGEMERRSSADPRRIHLITGQMTILHVDDACRIGGDVVLVSDHQ